MELITIILSSLLSVFSSGGFVLNRLAHQQVNNYLDSAEELAIRIDNTPNYKIARGKVDRFRLAARGIHLEPDLRIDSLELETDPIDLNLAKVKTETIQQLRSSLRKPLQGVFALVIKEEDIAQTLQSEMVINKLQKSLNDAISSRVGGGSVSYKIIDPQIELSAPNNLNFKVTLNRQLTGSQKESNSTSINQSSSNPTSNNLNPQNPTPRKLAPTKSPDLLLNLNMTIDSVAGKQVRLTNLTGTINDRPLSSRLLKGFAEGISDRLDLSSIEKSGIFSRLLKLKITENELELIGFVRMETKSSSINSSKLEKLDQAFSELQETK